MPKVSKKLLKNQLNSNLLSSKCFETILDVKLNPFSKVLSRPGFPGETLSLNRELFVSKAEEILQKVKKRKYGGNTEGNSKKI